MELNDYTRHDAATVGAYLFPLAPEEQATRQGESWIQANLKLDALGKRIPKQERIMQ
jgi:hypothetical protein